MSKFVRVKEAPETVTNDEFIIKGLNFLEEIQKFSKLKPKNKHTTVSYLRNLVTAIGDKYIPEEMNFNAYSSVNLNSFRERPFENNDDIDSILKQAFLQFYPQIVDFYVGDKLKSRPPGTKLIYFTGDHLQTGKFFIDGIEEIKAKDVEVFMGRAKKKIVGKPAITKEAAKVLNNT